MNGLPRLTLGDDEVSVEVPQNSYVSYSDRRSTQYREPAPITAGKFTISTSDDIGGEVTIFVTRPDKTIKDVMVFGNYVTSHQVGPSAPGLVPRSPRTALTHTKDVP